MSFAKGMHRIIYRFLPIVLPFAFVQCSGLTHRAILTPCDDRHSTGIRYYDTSPYLFIHTDNEGGLISEFLYLPDLTKKRAAKPFAFLAKNKTTLTWDAEGVVLTGSDADLDSSDVPKAVASALEEVGKTFVKSLAFDLPEKADSGEAKPKAPEAYLFKIVKRNHQWGLLGTKTGTPDFLPGVAQ